MPAISEILRTAGRATTITGSTPGAGTEANLVIPTRTRILITTVSWTFTTATSARHLTLVATRSALILLATKPHPTFGTGTWRCCAMAGVSASFSVHTTAAIFPWPVDLLLEQGDILSTATTGLIGTDQHSALTIFGYELPILA